MALTKCNECGHKVSDRSKTCPNCGVEIEAKPVKKKRSKLLMVLIGAMVIIGFTQFIESRMPPEIREANAWVRAERAAQERAQRVQAEAEKAARNEKQACANRASAYVNSQKHVRAVLKVPSTAKFPASNDPHVRVIHLGDCKHRIVAYVDSQNSFGAMIRTPYYVEMQYIRNSRNKWRLLDLKIQ